MSAKHTPGPWHVGSSEEDIWARRHGRLVHIADVVSGNSADVRMIAEAPAMAVELRETLRDIETWDGSHDALEVIKENLRAILARVEA